VIDINPYNPDWPRQFTELRERLSPHLGDVSAAIEHIGSTAVPGLAAKPVIDIDVVIPRHAKVITVIGRLARLGYVHRGNLGVENREVFNAPPALPLHHLYVCRRGSVPLRNHLTFRDHLRRFPDDLAAYAALKAALAVTATDAAAYTNGKTDFVLSILSKYDFSDEDLAEIRHSNN
jgi:GrpB-like predicted nucleotidyltransferase (UPF0157 family)